MKQTEMVILAFYAIINVITFCFFAYDKRQAKNHGWRVKEKTLLTLCALGGAPLGLAAMYTCRHKTRKPLFYIGVPALLAAHLLLLFVLFHKGILTP